MASPSRCANDLTSRIANLIYLSPSHYNVLHSDIVRWGGRRKKGKLQKQEARASRGQAIIRQEFVISSSGSEDFLSAFGQHQNGCNGGYTAGLCVQLAASLLGSSLLDTVVIYMSRTCQTTKVRPVLSVHFLSSFPSQSSLPLIF